jgi:SAM-dependent methyltransferase
MKQALLERVAEHLACYEDVAREYYDQVRHPTCRDLRELSARFLVPRLREGLPKDGNLVEMGPGLSILAPEAAAAGALSQVILVDSSPCMLSYSNRWIANSARSILASADATGLPSQTVSLVVSSLGDPYNYPGYWREVARLLKPGGTCLFTTPSFEWSSIFRPDGEREFAEFVRADGARLFMPSYVSREEDQVKMIEAAGLCVQDRRPFGTEFLGTIPAPKLRCVGPRTPVLAAYVIRSMS